MDIVLGSIGYVLICGVLGGLCLWLMGKLARLGISYEGMFVAALATHLTAHLFLIAALVTQTPWQFWAGLACANIVLFFLLRKFTGGSLLPRIVVIVLLYNAVLFLFTWVLIGPAGLRELSELMTGLRECYNK